MLLSEAVRMLAHDDLISPGKTIWADMGCGSGTFTLALAGLLLPQSIVYAMDRDPTALKQIPNSYNAVTIEKRQGDFVTDNFTFQDLDGILLANSLHYVRDKNFFIRKAVSSIKPEGRFLIIEYDTDIPNPWVPFPISISLLKTLFSHAGFLSFKKIAEQPSVYGRANMYSVIIGK